MRKTYSLLIMDCQETVQDTSASALTFIKRTLNEIVGFMYAKLQLYPNQTLKQTTTVADQTYYHKPVDCVQLESVVVTVGELKYRLTPVRSQQEWDRLTAVPATTTTVPEYFFQRADDFGVWPTPQSAETMTLHYFRRGAKMTIDDYTTGTVSVTNGSATVTGSGTTFTSAMAGRWFKVDNDERWYRVAEVSSATVLALEDYYDGLTASGQTYRVGQSPDFPEDLHELIPYGVADRYYTVFRKNAKQAALFSNLFWTGDSVNGARDMRAVHGGLLDGMKRYSKRVSSPLIKMKPLSADTETDYRWSHKLPTT